MLNLNQENLLRIAIVVIVGGIVLIGATYLVEFLLPLISVAVVIVIAYFAYRFFKTGTFKF